MTWHKTQPNQSRHAFLGESYSFVSITVIVSSALLTLPILREGNSEFKPALLYFKITFGLLLMACVGGKYEQNWITLYI